MSRQSLDMAYGRQGGRIVPWIKEPVAGEGGGFRRVWVYPRSMPDEAFKHADQVAGYVAGYSAWTLAVITHDEHAVWPSKPRD